MENRAWESQAGQAGGETALEAAELLAAAAEAVPGRVGRNCPHQSLPGEQDRLGLRGESAARVLKKHFHSE